MKQHSSIKSNWKASVNFWLQISHNKTKNTKKQELFTKSKCIFFSKKAKAYLSLRARATERNFTHKSKSIYLLKSKSKSPFIFKSKSKSMCIAHFNPQNQVYIIKALYLLHGLHQCWTLTICKKRNLRGWYFQWDLLFLPLVIFILSSYKLWMS